MAEWMVAYSTEAWSYIVVDADTEEEARDIAEDAFDPPPLCFACADNVEVGEWYQDRREGATWQVEKPQRSTHTSS